MAEKSSNSGYFLPEELRILIHYSPWRDSHLLRSRYAVIMQIQIELTEESRELLMRHFKERAALHEILARAQRTELAGIGVYSFECE